MTASPLQSSELEHSSQTRRYRQCCKLSLQSFLEKIGFKVILGEEEFTSKFYVDLTWDYFGSNRETIYRRMNQLIAEATQEYLVNNQEDILKLTDNLMDNFCSPLAAYTVSRIVVGKENYKNPTLLKTFLDFDNDAKIAMGKADIMPFPTSRDSKLEAHYKTIYDILRPTIMERRKSGSYQSDGDGDLLSFIMRRVNDDVHVARLVGIMVWGGLTNLCLSLTHLLTDIAFQKDAQAHIWSSIKNEDVATLYDIDSNEKNSNSPWALLTSVMLESLRLATNMAGPSRLVIDADQPLCSFANNSVVKVKRGEAFTFCPYFVHRDESNWAQAKSFLPHRFLKSPCPAGQTNFLSWGISNHVCPGRFFAANYLRVVVKEVLSKHRLSLIAAEKEEDASSYRYVNGQAFRCPGKIRFASRLIEQVEISSKL